MGFWENVKRFNDRWNDLPRRSAIVLMVLAALFVLGALFSYVAPTVIAMILAWLIRPVARRLETLFRRIRLPARLASLIAVLVVYGAISTVVVFIGARLVQELRSLIAALPGWINQAIALVTQWTDGGGLEMLELSPEILAFLNWVLNEALTALSSLATRLVGSVATWTLDTAMNLPQMVLFVVLTVMGTFYMVADRERILAFFRRWIPRPFAKRLTLLKDTVFRGIAGQVKAALIMMVLITVELSVGFVILRVPYSVLLALLIGVMDALPIIGAGLFLIPMAAYGFVAGNFALGAGVAILYFLTIVTRQIVEPRVVSVQLGLYPLLTMASMYAGLRLIGFAGMLLAPVMVLILKAALSNPADADLPRAARRARRFVRKQKRPPAAGA